jgi:nitroimidazol reductase NimA-like FMN-containing flavoprotein (pyridoxamine 5'-phosphate oxidase superfamily)
MTRMSRPDCIAGLTRTRVGRVAVTDQAMPAVIPVNYALVGDTIVFRTRGDGLLARACDGSVVAFEVDELADDGGHGWSILVVGTASLLTGNATRELGELQLVSAMGEGRDQYVSISLGRVSGRWVGAARLADDPRDPAVTPLRGTG